MNLGATSRRSVPCDGSPYLYLVPGKRDGPAALGFDHLVNLGHEAGRLIQGDDDLLVVLNGRTSGGVALWYIPSMTVAAASGLSWAM